MYNFRYFSLLFLHIFCLSVFTSLIIAKAADAKEWNFKLTHPYFMDNPSQKTLDKYTVDNNGLIIDGPRRGPKEPIDYTDLMSNKAILDSFTLAVFACGTPIDQCRKISELATFDRWEKKKIKVYIGYEEEAVKNNKSEFILKAINSIYDDLGIDVLQSDHKIDSTIYFLLGSIDYFKKFTNEILDMKFLTETMLYIFKLLDEESFKKKYFAFFSSFPAKCLVSYRNATYI